MTVTPRSAGNVLDVKREARIPARGLLTYSAETRLDIQCCALLLSLTAIMVLPGSLTLPMELWDESRNANNALEIARHGGWMVPRFDGMPDHWNTKPPLLIWIIAALSRTGLDPMLAVRLPSVVAAMATVLLVYLSCRIVIRDRLAGTLGGMLVICSTLFMGDHVGRTGDYDALLSMLCLGFVLCVGHYIDHGSERPGWWIGAAAVLLFLGIMTKGIAACMTLPGLLAYAIGRWRFAGMIRDWRLWPAMLGVIVAVAGWLALREYLDPGYLAAAWYNDVSGRLLVALDDHSEGPLFYVEVLAQTFQPAILLSPALLLLCREGDPVRLRFGLLMILPAASWLIAVSCASTKISWYIAPVVPLLAIAIATSATACIRRLTTRFAWVVMLVPTGIAMVITFWLLNVRPPDVNGAYAADNVWYGPFLGEISGEAGVDGAIILDLGLPNDAGFQHYNPVALFFASEAERHGVHIQVATPAARIARDTTVISCDPRVRAWLNTQTLFTLIRSNPRCILGRIAITP